MNSGFVCLQIYMGKFHFAISFNIAAVEGPCSHNHVQDVLELQNIEVKVLLAGHIFGKL